VMFLASGFDVPVALLLLLLLLLLLALALLSQPTTLVRCDSVLCSTWTWYMLDYD